MRSRSRTSRHGVHSLLLAGAVAMGLGVLFPLHAQESGLPARGPVQKADKAATAAPGERLRAQQRATRKAKAAYEIAKLTREIAVIAVIEYKEGIFAQDLATVDGVIKLAESDLTRAQDRLDWARRMLDKGFVSMAQKVSEELTFKKAQFTLEQARSKRKVLVEYTRGKTIKELVSEVENARVSEVVKRKAWELEKAKEAELERQLLPDTK